MDYISVEDVQLSGFDGRFDGVKSRLVVKTSPATPYDQPLVMRLTYREAQEIREPMVLASSSELLAVSYCMMLCKG